MVHLVLAAQLLAVNAVPAAGSPGAGTTADASARRASLALRVPMPPPGPSLVPSLRARDLGAFQPLELTAAAAGASLGDVAVLGAGYGTLQLFAHGAIPVTASNMRNAALALGVSALIVPPLLASALAAWARRGAGDGAWWKSLLLAGAGQALALAAGVAFSPAYWAMLPVQLALVPLAASAGLHWGPGRTGGDLGARAPELADAGASRAAAAVAEAAFSPPACPVE